MNPRPLVCEFSHRTYLITANSVEGSLWSAPWARAPGFGLDSHCQTTVTWLGCSGEKAQIEAGRGWLKMR